MMGAISDVTVQRRAQDRQKLLAEGAEIGFTHLPGEKMERRVRKLTDPIGAKMLVSCDTARVDGTKAG